MWPVHSLNDVVDINILSSIWSIYLINNIVLSNSQNSLFFFYKKIFCFTSKKENKKKNHDKDLWNQIQPAVGD